MYRTGDMSACSQSAIMAHNASGRVGPAGLAAAKLLPTDAVVVRSPPESVVCSWASWSVALPRLHEVNRPGERSRQHVASAWSASGKLRSGGALCPPKFLLVIHPKTGRTVKHVATRQDRLPGAPG